jgi:hypothetical protein
MARKYPPGTKFFIHGKIMHVVGYNENGGLSVSATNPFHNYEKAIAELQPICEHCIKDLDALKI